MAQIKINGAYVNGVMMGDGFLNALHQPLERKECIYNESRLKNGKTLVDMPNRFKARSLVLTFVVFGETKADFETNKAHLLDLVDSDKIELSTSHDESEVHELIYTGKNVSYADNGLSCLLTLGFNEPKPYRKRG